MSRRQQHPLIVAMNKFDAILASLTGESAETFVAYVRNKVNVRQRPKSQSTTAPRANKKLSQKLEPKVIGQSSETNTDSAMTASGD